MRKNNLWITALHSGYRYRLTGRKRYLVRNVAGNQTSLQRNAGRQSHSQCNRGNDINKLAVNNDSKNNFDTYFSNKVNSKGITNQKSSGRCWLFTGLNVIRAQVIAKYNLPEFELSQNYNFFWDQLEKAKPFPARNH